MATVEERVAAGVAWLDEKAPGWWGREGRRYRISLSRLRIASTDHCICGQLRIWPGVGDPWLTGGFNGTGRWDFQDLDIEWARVIAARRSAAA
jgi:hypothetical protein